MLVELRGYVENTSVSTHTFTYVGETVTLPPATRTTDTLYFHKIMGPLVSGLRFVKTAEDVLPLDAHAALGWGDQITVKRANGERTIATLDDVIAFIQSRFGLSERGEKGEDGQDGAPGEQGPPGDVTPIEAALRVQLADRPVFADLAAFGQDVLDALEGVPNGETLSKLAAKTDLAALGNAVLDALADKAERAAAVPATRSAPGTAGQITSDAGFVYVCVAPNTWKRAALASW